MPSPETLWVFAVASAGLVLLPGPAIIYIATRGIVHGRRGGLTSMLGVESGNVLQVLAATAGLAAIVASSACGPFAPARAPRRTSPCRRPPAGACSGRGLRLGR